MGAPIAPAMLARIMADAAAAGLAHDPVARGYVVAYHGPATPCPGCSRSNWLVGRQLAECAFCATALPIGPRC